ncbi:hypothetical protein BBJ29_007534 [Phytophthora kernoviae]|uniref:Yippee domain-containing protein n=1 Tax=Phytophthora kernoviae TaxID=325452 RepID=A0A3F2REH3_9STRA|nr:hypothetical protein BBP00_00008758 [Phytophthora kernoviae]RLN58239.1 hypothetical protein BBJ29_007534 [Phytophthora kernoviae]
MTQQEHEAAYRLRSSGACVRVVQDTTKVDGLGGEVWAGALVLCEFLDANDTDYVCGRDVVELGAGCGLCGLVAAALGAKTAILTDEYPDLLASNIAMNCHIWAEREAKSDSEVATSGALEWGVLESIAPFVHKFDTVLGSEITQLGRDLHAPLLETVHSVLRPGANSVALLSMDLCRASCEGTCDVSKCTASHFVAAAKQTGFSVHKHPSVRLGSREAVTTLVGALVSASKMEERSTFVFQAHQSAIILLCFMPPLVVIRSGCKHVEYLKSRTVWRRAPRVGLPSDSEEDAADDQESEDDALLRQAEDNWRMSIGNSCNVSKVSGLSSELCDVGGMHAFRCADCGNIVADRDDIVSKTFFGRTGKAFLMNNMYNIRIGSARNRYLMTGMHTIGDVLCSQCDFVLGWKYIKAMESSQKYKEGKFIMEQAVVQDDSEEQAWNRL